MKNFEEKIINFYISVLSSLEIHYHKFLCFFGLHDWSRDSLRDYLTRGQETHRCLYCNKKTKRMK